MALINNIYVQCEDESITDDVELTSHPTESGLPLSDTVRKTAKQLDIKGKIVSYEDLSVDDILNKLNSLKNQGSLIEFRGKNTLTNLQISKFTHSSSYRINGGVEFSMALTERRIAKSSYTPAKNSTKVVTPKVNSTVFFKGGYVYVSSDAEKPAAKRGSSTCKLTKISKLSGATHIYHLISKDGGNVYGWVDASNVTAVVSSIYSDPANGGLQLVSIGAGEEIYHTVKKGDTIYNLVNKSYKYLNTTVSTVIKNNPNCFSKPGDAKTLIIGSRLYMGAK